MIVVDDWAERRDSYLARVRPWVEPRLRRRQRGQSHPVDDFLFDYYPYRPGRLLQWHPGHGRLLAGSRDDVADWLRRDDYAYVDSGAAVTDEALDRRAEEIRRTTHLLTATRARRPRFGCFGLHEWAMVYRLQPNEIRHASWSLRLSPDEIADVVDEQGLRCTHFDAFRFYSDDARPLNERRLTRETQADDEQGGCLHATMDLYKWSVRLLPLVASDLVADCLELAREARELDMRASPYDLADLGYAPIPVESEAGRRDYVAHQRRIADAGDDLRGRLIDALTPLAS